MKKIVAIAMLGTLLAGVGAFAADAVVGTWKLNVAKSTFKPGPPPAAETRIYQAQPKGVKTTVKTTWADQKTTTVEYPANYDGKDYPVEGSRDVDAVALTRMDDFTSAATLKHAGKEIGVARRVGQFAGILVGGIPDDERHPLFRQSRKAGDDEQQPASQQHPGNGAKAPHNQSLQPANGLLWLRSRAALVPRTVPEVDPSVPRKTPK